MSGIVERFRLPEKAKINQRIYTKDIVLAADAKGKEKSLLEKGISTVYLVGILNEKTTGVWAFENDSYMYKEIQVFLVNVKDASKAKALNDELQRIFPNPAIMIFASGSKYMVGTAMKRLSRNEKGKMVIDSTQTTSWFALDDEHNALLDRIDYDQRNLKEIYEHFDYLMSAEYVLRVTGKIPDKIDFTIKSKSVMIQRLVEEKNKWLAQEKQESSMQGKMQCHMRISDIQKQLDSIQ